MIRMITDLAKTLYWICEKFGVLEFFADRLKENDEFRDAFLDEQQQRYDILEMAQHTSRDWDVDETPLRIAERYEKYIQEGEFDHE